MAGLFRLSLITFMKKYKIRLTTFQEQYTTVELYYSDSNSAVTVPHNERMLTASCYNSYKRKNMYYNHNFLGGIHKLWGPFLDICDLPCLCWRLYTYRLGMLKNSHKVAIHNLESTMSQNYNGSKKIRKFGCVRT